MTVIDYKSDSKNSADELFKQFDYMTSISKEIECNRQILHQLQKSLQSKFEVKSKYRALIIKNLRDSYDHESITSDSLSKISKE